MRKSLFAVLTAAMSLSNLGYTGAQTGPTGPQTPSTPTAPAAPAVNGISENQVLNYLRTLDPNVKMQKSQDGKAAMFELKLRRSDWNFELLLVLREGCLEILTPLGGPIAKDQNLPAPAMAQLLVENAKTREAKFAFYTMKDGRRQLVYCVLLPRDHLSTANMGNVLNAVCELVQKSYPLWNPVVNGGR